MTLEEKKNKSFAEISASIAQVIKKPLTEEEVRKINSILENDGAEKLKDEKPPKAALPQDPEANA